MTIDDRLLVVARSRAHARGTSVGEEISQLALRALEAERSPRLVPRNGLLVLPATPGHVITDEMVADALDEEL